MTISDQQNIAMGAMTVPFRDPTTSDFVVLAAICAVFAACAFAELLWPARRGAPIESHRMTKNFGLGIGNMLLGAILPLSSLVVAGFAEARGWGLFNQWPVVWWIELALLCLGSSALFYAIHRIFHHVDWLWPLHAVHHHDQNVDLSTTFRTHPVAYLITLGANFLFVLAVGPTLLLLLVVEAVMLSVSIVEHSNARLPDRWSNRLERLFITPRMHLVHHARERDLHDSNYGTLFSLWDHMFGTYRRPPDEVFSLGAVQAEPRTGGDTLSSV
jgi:sterol desaturase/sphingolipid hydroxylase (fatty acid hydroxylase superfamily)